MSFIDTPAPKTFDVLALLKECPVKFSVFMPDKYKISFNHRAKVDVVTEVYVLKDMNRSFDLRITEVRCRYSSRV